MRFLAKTREHLEGSAIQEVDIQSGGLPLGTEVHLYLPSNGRDTTLPGPVPGLPAATPTPDQPQITRKSTPPRLPLTFLVPDQKDENDDDPAD
jgi:hypothetical protein